MSSEPIRAFLALEIPDEIKDKIMEVEGGVERSNADVKLVERENLHVTMKFLGDVTASTLDKVYDVMKRVKESKFEIEVKGTGVFPNLRMVRVLWVGIGAGSDKVTAVFRTLDSGIAELGFHRERDFTPHITIGRVRSQRNREELIKAMEKYGSDEFGTAVVDKIIIKRSILMQRGPIYSNLREVELQG